MDAGDQYNIVVDRFPGDESKTWTFSMLYGQNKTRNGTIYFGGNPPMDLPIIQFEEPVTHPYMDGTRYKLDVEKWSKNYLDVNGLLLDIHEQFKEHHDMVDEEDNHMIFDLRAEGFSPENIRPV